VCGSNGSNSSKAEKILYSRGVLVVYDFLAKRRRRCCIIFEWLRNLYQRYNMKMRSSIKENLMPASWISLLCRNLNKGFMKFSGMKNHLQSTVEWNKVLRDIIFTAVNEDYQLAKKNNVSMKDAGFMNSQFRVLSAALGKLLKR